jgi:putative FmdB family regulatory protein
MPTYEYICSKCDQTFEVVQSMSAAPLEICPKEMCRLKRWGKGRVKRGVGGGAGLIFKGSGFYITDYRSEGYKAAAKQETPSAPSGTAKPGSEAKPAAKTDAKPAAKPESKPGPKKE